MCYEYGSPRAANNAEKTKHKNVSISVIIVPPNRDRDTHSTRAIVCRRRTLSNTSSICMSAFFLSARGGFGVILEIRRNEIVDNDRSEICV